MTASFTDRGSDETLRLQVLDALPTAVVVVDFTGTVIYGNAALARLSGVTVEEGLDTNMLEYVHPDDEHWLAEAFVHLGRGGDAVSEIVERPWAPIKYRLIGADGTTIPVEATGTGQLHMNGIEAVIYELRPAHEQDIFHRVLAGVASSGDAHEHLDLIVELISASALDIDSAVVRWSIDGGCEIVTAASDELQEILHRAALDDGLGCFSEASQTPAFSAVHNIDGDVGAALAGLGYQDAWHIDVASGFGSWTYRVLGFTTVHQVPARGVIDRLEQAAELASVVLLRTHAEEQLAHAALHDELTGLRNRSGLRALMDDRSDRLDELSVLFVDLDGFKEINDRHGHRQGDSILQMVAVRLEGAAPDGSVVARLGGDEFAVLVTDHDIDGAAAIARTIAASLARPFTSGGRQLTISASVGIAAVQVGHNVEIALAEADQAMYSAKRAGGNRVHLSGGAEALPR